MHRFPKGPLVPTKLYKAENTQPMSEGVSPNMVPPPPTTRYGVGGGGTIFGLTPSDIGWVFSALYSFVGTSGPLGNLCMDAAGNFYGTTFADGAYGLGSVFKLSPGPSGWTYTSLHDFTGGDDGANPVSNVLFDAAGNLYGTASAGGNK